jgi:hypothetical protein
VRGYLDGLLGHPAPAPWPDAHYAQIATGRHRCPTQNAHIQEKTPLAFRCSDDRPGSVPALYEGALIGAIHIAGVPQKISHRFIEFRNAATIAVHDDA